MFGMFPMKTKHQTKYWHSEKDVYQLREETFELV